MAAKKNQFAGAFFASDTAKMWKGANLLDTLKDSADGLSCFMSTATTGHDQRGTIWQILFDSFLVASNRVN
jgi:hypothetical protein